MTTENFDSYSTSNDITGRFNNQSKEFADGVELGSLIEKFKTGDLLKHITVSNRILGDALKFAVLHRYVWEDIKLWNDDYFTVNFYPLAESLVTV